MSGHETLVDGHNAAHRLRLRGGSVKVRETVIDRVRALVKRGAIVHFDGHPERGAFGGTEINGVTVRFSGSEVADNAIVAHVRASKKPRCLTVVTDDLELARRVEQLGAKSIRVGPFFAKVPKPPKLRVQVVPSVEAPASYGVTAADFGLPETVDLDRPPADLDNRQSIRPRTKKLPR
ncbi:MAG: NYN domain-containing protein [Planctomycetes bacterium]|nr:NYN domain-containing protein [Planctomycetota bacterium]